MQDLIAMAWLYAAPLIALGIVAVLVLNAGLIISACKFVECNQPDYRSAMFLSIIVTLLEGGLIGITGLLLSLAGMIDAENEKILLKATLYSIPVLVPVSAVMYSKLLGTTLVKGVSVFLMLLLMHIVIFTLIERLLG